jgi:cyclin B
VHENEIKPSKHRTVLTPHLQWSGAAILAGKQKVAAADRRRALGDIGNVVTDVLDG